MPRISYFYGIAIYMYYRDHPPSHFHAIYGEQEATVAIQSADILDGQLPPKASAMVREWATMHTEELEQNWEFARAGEPLLPIAPLE